MRLTPEARLLVSSACAVGRFRGVDRPVPDAFNWVTVGQLAEREKLLPVLWPALAAYHDQIPDEIAQAMRRQAVVTEFRMMALEDRLRRVVRLLDEHGIQVVLMKGAAMALTIYGSFAQRPMGDLDILVREADAQPAWDLLRSFGWELEYPDDLDAEAFYADHQHLIPLVAPGGGNAVLEIHRCLLYPRGPFQLPEEHVWDAALPVDVGGCTAYVPAWEHQVLHLCLHFAWSHAMGKGLGRTVRDLGALLDGIELDWNRLLELARETRSETCCYWTLRLARKLGGVSIPEGVLEALAPRSPRVIRNALERIIIADALDPLQGGAPSVQLGQFVWERAILPEASGHGDLRPWTVNAGWADVAKAPPPPGFFRRLGGQLGRIPEWLRFLGVVMGWSRGATNSTDVADAEAPGAGGSPRIIPPIR